MLPENAYVVDIFRVRGGLSATSARARGAKGEFGSDLDFGVPEKKVPWLAQMFPMDIL